MIGERHKLLYRSLYLVGLLSIAKCFIFDNLPEVPKPKIPDLITDTIDKVVFRNKCIEDLGCFYTGPPFYHALYRPIVLTPSSKVKTKFWLFTKDGPENGTLISTDPESLRNSSFDENSDVKFLTHGFLTKLEPDDKFHKMKDEFLKQGDYNIIIVDWTDFNGNPYMQAVANTRVVGAQIAKMIQVIKNETGIDEKRVHLIGHSLGSHISGFAGERTPGLSRISALDPAGPWFRFGPKEICLDETDADFVDVIHTDTGSIVVSGLGIPEAFGHLDFYPNGGVHQPGCEPTLVNVTVAGINVTLIGSGEGITTLMATSCDHSRSISLYTATINDCKFMGTECDSYENFEEGKCENNTQVRMGYYARKSDSIPRGADDKESRKYYLDTGDEYPFCLEESYE